MEFSSQQDEQNIKTNGNSWVIKNVHQGVKIEFILTSLFFTILHNADALVTKKIISFKCEYKSKQAIQIKSSTWLGQKKGENIILCLKDK